MRIEMEILGKLKEPVYGQWLKSHTRYQETLHEPMLNGKAITCQKAALL